MRSSLFAALRRGSLAALVLMAGCGGGGGDGGGGPQDYAVRTAMGHWLNDGGSWTVNGKGPAGQSYSLNIQFSAMKPGAIPIVGGMAARTVETLTATIDGASVDGAVTYYYDSASLSFIASDNGTGGCSVATAKTAMPSNASTGAGGAIYAASDYDGCAAGAAVISTSSTDWSLETAAGFALLCLNQTALGPARAAPAVQSTCVEIAADGTLGGRAHLFVSLVGVTLIDAGNF
jgi:hypothetical protein